MESSKNLGESLEKFNKNSFKNVLKNVANFYGGVDEVTELE